MSFDRMHKASDELVTVLSLRGAGKHGIPSERDSRRFLVKTLRELRHAVALKSPVDLSALAQKVSEHLGTHDAGGNLEKPADVAAISKFLKAELDEFTAHAEKQKAELGQHATFHEDLGFIDQRSIKAEHLNDIGIIPSRPIS